MALIMYTLTILAAVIYWYQKDPLYKLDISSESHPYFTGQQNLVDTAGRIEKFNQKYNLQEKKSSDSKTKSDN